MLWIDKGYFHVRNELRPGFHYIDTMLTYGFACHLGVVL